MQIISNVPSPLPLPSAPLHTPTPQKSMSWANVDLVSTFSEYLPIMTYSVVLNSHTDYCQHTESPTAEIDDPVTTEQMH